MGGMDMTKRFEGKTAVVTGAGSSIGAQIALRLAEEGAKVMILGRQEATLKESAAQHENIFYEEANLWNSDDIARVLGRVKEEFGRLDVLVNNAGWAPVTPLKDVQMDEVESAFKTNVFGVIDMSRQALPMILESKGNIVNISSTVGNYPLPNMSVYSASKAAVTALTRLWAKELAKDGVRVNCVVVGPIETPIYDKTDLDDEGAKKHREFVLSTVPLHRFGEPDDIARVVLYLASEEANFVTGAGFTVDGGVLA